MQEEIFQKVAKLIAANNDLPVESITMDSSFEDLNMDSLDGLILLNDLENDYNITLSNEAAMKIKSVRQTVESLAYLLIPQRS